MNSDGFADSPDDAIASGNPAKGAPADIAMESAIPAAAAEPEAVLDRVQQQTKRRRRRRGQPPGWILWVARTASRSRNFLSQSLPAWFITHREESVSYVASFLVLALACLIMALWALPPADRFQIFDLIVTRDEQFNEALEIVEVAELVQPESIVELEIDSTVMHLDSDSEGEEVAEQQEMEDKVTSVVVRPTDAQIAQVLNKGEFGGRSKKGRQVSVSLYGGTVDSEKSVASGLRWLKSIQRKDGSWNFSQPGPGAKAGSYRRTEVGATSMALLCFLGAGHTHADKGPYQDTVKTGLAYIGKQAVINQGTADLRGSFEGNSGMYVHGLATICISEAHALDHRDKDLKKLTEMAINFIEAAQDPVDGGWRYKPRDDVGDTSVVGWQIMAMQSAKSGTVRFSNRPLQKARTFLNSVQVDDIGSSYAYVPTRLTAKNSMTAVALLCRMYMGWKKDNEGLRKGVHHLSAIGPSRSDIYYNYYASQVLHHWGGELWEKWNKGMREQLVRTQIKKGPATGSWAPTDSHGNRGGQIYQSTLSILTLEIYYRHLPIYRKLKEAPSDPTQVSVRL